jgi:3'-phosphoadenosine 5'-phosphosulfate sulfotransferase (PAPS reductase)/FAD synthetase
MNGSVEVWDSPQPDWGLAMLDQAIAEHGGPERCKEVWGLFSGGHDSLTATWVASHHPQFTGVLHIDTGIGIEATRDFVRETCRERGWPLQVFRAADCGIYYEDLVLRWGFPGPPGHGVMYNRLKERALRKFIRSRKKGWWDRIVLASGCRRQESTRRMGHTEAIQREYARIWVAVIQDMTKSGVNDTVERAGLKRNQVVDLIHKSGECLCGAYAKPGELEELALWFPDVAARIRSLESLAETAGFPWKWEGRPPKGYRTPKTCETGHLCWSCDKTEEVQSQ